MATARVKTEEKVSGIDLSLSVKEAQILIALLDNIGGDPKGPRGLLDNVLQALVNIEVKGRQNWLCLHTPSIKLMVHNPQFYNTNAKVDAKKNIPSRIYVNSVYIENGQNEQEE
jgi:hypothetical protein